MKLNKGSFSPKFNSVLDEMLDCSRELMEAVEELKRDARADAEKSDIMARAKAKAIILSKDKGKSAEIREAYADAGYAEQRKEAFLAKAEKEAQLEKVRGLRQRLSALQTFVNSTKAEADAFHYGQAE